MIGTTIGPYEVLSKLGAGGMGEVYRARDATLGREVAIKVLPAEFAGDPERLARFQREARALAALNHPRIAAIYGCEEVDGRRVVVMELAPGTSLADRLARGPLPVREALAAGRQIAEGIEAAHERGIIHRDLKPANVHVTGHGEVKILDFGLAKVFGAPGSADPGLHGDSADTPTLTAQTGHGAVLGTAAYMSPEQARGLAVDTRTDIWAFGCVLYECLTGKRAFPGQTIPDTLAAVLEREPDWAALPAATPPTVRVLLGRCLRKDARERLRDIGDARLELADPSASGATAAATAAGHPLRPAWRHPLPVGLALVTLAFGSALLWALLRVPAPGAPGPVTRFSVQLPPGRQLVSELHAIALSPDGRELVVAVEEDRGRPGPLDDMVQLYRRSMDDLAVTPIPGTDMGGGPFFSPDGEWVGFSGSGGLRKVSLRGGAPIAVPDADSGTGTWMHDDRVVYTTKRDLFLLPAGGGKADTLLSWSQLQKGEVFIDSPSAVPGTDAFLVNLTGLDSSRSTIAEWSGGVLTRILVGGGGLVPIYLSTGHLLYERLTQPGGSRYDVYAVPFDPVHMRLTGKEVPVLEDVRFGQLAVSATGTLAYNSRGDDKTTEQLVWFDRAGSTVPIAEKQVDLGYKSPRLSPDGSRLLYAIGHDNSDSRLFVRNLATGAMHTVGGRSAWWAAWTPDSRRVVYIRMNPEGTAGNLFSQAADGAGPEDRLTKGDRHQQPQFVTPDGSRVVFNEQSPDTGYDLWQVSLRGDRTPTPLLQTRANEHLAALTHDGRYMAYASDETGRDEVWVRAFPGGEGVRQVSTEGGTAPLWASDGRTLFYRDAGGTRLFAVPVTWNPGPVFGEPTVVHGWWQPDTAWARNYDVTPDGRRLVMIVGTSTAGNEITVVQNWFEELKQKMAMK